MAGNNWQRHYIAHTFGDAVETLPLDGYNIQYSTTGAGFIPAIIRQIPKIFKTIRREHQWLEELCSKRHFDGIISDNRYGLHHPNVHSVIMTHQLQLLSGMGAMADAILRRWHYGYLEKFDECHVVDVAGTPNYSGKLGHPAVLPRNAQYIGILSQMDAAQGQPVSADGSLLVLLSGPEPQRSILEEILWKQVQAHSGKVVFVTGSNDSVTPAHIPAHISYHKRITKDQLQPLLLAAGMVVCRSGYSTVMDLVTLHKPAILIPTPGQTEQEYLARHLQAEGLFTFAPQKGFNLQAALQRALPSIAVSV